MRVGSKHSISQYLVDGKMTETQLSWQETIMHEETNFFVGKKTLNRCLCGKALLISLHTEEFSDS